MKNGQRYAIEIEHIIKDVFSCERFGFGGVANSDFIRSQPFTAIIAALAYQFATADENQAFYSSQSEVESVQANLDDAQAGLEMSIQDLSR